MTSGYEVTIKTFIPVDPTDFDAMRRAGQFIETLKAAAAGEEKIPYDSVVATKFIQRRKGRDEATSESGERSATKMEGPTDG